MSRTINDRGVNERWVVIIFCVFFLPFCSYAQTTQMLLSFDLDPLSDPEIDGLISVGPPVAAIGNEFAPLTVDPTFTPSMISNKNLHLVARAVAAVDLDGPGKIIYAGPKHDLEGIYIGSGLLPKVTGTHGLTRLNINQPTSYEFTRGEALYIYYVTEPEFADCTFAELFGDGSRSVLTLLTDFEKIPAPPIKARPIREYSQTPRIKKPVTPSRPPAKVVSYRPQPVAKKIYTSAPAVPRKITPLPTQKNPVTRPLLALFSKTTTASAKAPVAPKPLFSGKHIAKLKQAIQANRAKNKSRPLFNLCKSSSSKSKTSSRRKTTSRNSCFCARASSSASKTIFFRKRRSRS